MNDTEVIRASLRAPSEFGVIFDRHFGAVYRYLRRRLGPELAADVSSEVFTLAFRDRERFAPLSTSALPWLLGIATNLLRMHYRSEERRLRAYGRTGGDDPGFGADGEIDDRLDARAAREHLAEALAQLPTRQRDVLLLSAWAELSPAEIAAALSLRPGTVRSELHRARNAVAVRLAARAPHLVPDQDPTR